MVSTAQSVLYQVWGALYVLRVLTRKYEFKDEDDRAPLAPVVNAAFPPLLAMLQVRRIAVHSRAGLVYQRCRATLAPKHQTPTLCYALNAVRGPLCHGQCPVVHPITSQGELHCKLSTLSPTNGR